MTVTPDPLEEEHSSVLPWKTPWTEEPGWLQSMGSQKSQTRLKRLNSSSIGSLGLLGHYSAPDFHSDSPFLISSPPLSKFYNISTLIPGISVNNSLCTQPFLCMLNALASIIILHVLPWGHIGWDGLSSHGTVLRFAGHLASLAHLHTRCQWDDNEPHCDLTLLKDPIHLHIYQVVFYPTTLPYWACSPCSLLLLPDHSAALLPNCSKLNINFTSLDLSPF